MCRSHDFQNTYAILSIDGSILRLMDKTRWKIYENQVYHVPSASQGCNNPYSSILREMTRNRHVCDLAFVVWTRLRRVQWSDFSSFDYRKILIHSNVKILFLILKFVQLHDYIFLKFGRTSPSYTSFFSRKVLCHLSRSDSCESDSCVWNRLSSFPTMFFPTTSAITM